MIKIINEAIDNETVKQKVKEYIEDKILGIEDNLSVVLASQIKGYDPEWCPADDSEVDYKNIDAVRDKYINEIVNILFKNENK